MHFVLVFDLEEGTAERLVGPFDSAREAMDWADRDSLARTAEAPDLERESSEDLILVASKDDDSEEGGWLYQVLEPSDSAIEAEVEEGE